MSFPTRLALFDLDHTLLPFDSDRAFGDFCVSKGWVEESRYIAGHEHFYRQYREGCLDIHAYVRFATEPLRRQPTATLLAAREEFVRDWVEPRLTPAMLALLEQHRDDLCALVTATNDFITAPIAARLGLPTLLATRLVYDDAGRITGEIAGTPCFREGKVERVQQWLGSLGVGWDDFVASSFYSDSYNDVPLLEAVRDPVAVDPDPKLLAHAQARGWRVLCLHSPASEAPAQQAATPAQQTRPTHDAADPGAHGASSGA